MSDFDGDGDDDTAEIICCPIILVLIIILVLFSRREASLADSLRTTEYNPDLPPVKDKIVAGVLGILLGGLGIHSFYLGYNQRGLVQIVVTVITLGAGAVWGFVEGILILVTEDWTDSEGRALKGQVRVSTNPLVSPPKDYIEELKGLKELLDSGVISKEEFEEKKKELL